jgi:alanine-glyoxylate transaminase/serine-glyoxylate transaminase/serine-pyruvate transaminase
MSSHATTATRRRRDERYRVGLSAVHRPGKHSSRSPPCSPQGHDADRVRQIILDRFDMSLGTGLGKLQGRIFRIGHLGYFNDLMLAGTLCGVEMGLKLAGVAVASGGVQAALEFLADHSEQARAAA